MWILNEYMIKTPTISLLPLLMKVENAIIFNLQSNVNFRKVFDYWDINCFIENICKTTNVNNIKLTRQRLLLFCHQYEWETYNTHGNITECVPSYCAINILLH